MYSLRLRCSTGQAELVSAELWDFGANAISESEADCGIVLLAGFDSLEVRELLLKRFSPFHPEWESDDTDWVEVTRAAWSPREIGRTLFLTPPWRQDPTPFGRHRVIHIPGQASGTGEHPCTQLGLEALEREVFSNCRVLDVGTGSGILAIAAVRLGASAAIGIDTDEDALHTARENFEVNNLHPALAAGSVECVAAEAADITVANISATVLLSIMDDLLRVTSPEGTLILTGFPRAEAAALAEYFRNPRVTYSGEWACVSAKPS